MAPGNPLVYLDYNATAPVLPEAVEAVTAHLADFGNPSSVHAAGRRARAAVEEARDAIGAAINASTSEIIFTSGGTEANALALRGLATAIRCTSVLATAVEHPSILAHVKDADQIGVDAHGVVDLEALENALKQRPAPVLVTVMLANNETGVLQPISAVRNLTRKYGAFLHCDAVQAVGKVAFDFRALGVDSASLSAHKFGGVKGTGALVLRKGLEITADIPGGGQERRRRAGTENVPGIIGFGAAAKQVTRLRGDAARIMHLRDGMESAIRRDVPHARILGQAVDRLGNTSCIILPGVSSETQVMRLDLAGVAVSAGSACSSGKIAPSHVLLAMGIGAAEGKAAIRVSLGWGTTPEDIARFLTVWEPLAANAAA